MFKIKVEFPQGPETAVVKFPDEPVQMTATDVGDLISSLAQVRAGMRPEVARDPVLIGTIRATMDPRFWIAPEPMLGGVALRLRDPGLGWVNFQVPQGEVATLINLLQTHCVAPAAPTTRAN